jgi:hypothetical protein
MWILEIVLRNHLPTCPPSNNMRNHLKLGKCIQTQFFSCFWYDDFLWWRGPGFTLTLKHFQMTLQHCNLQDHEHIDFCCIVRVVVRSFSSRGSYNFLVKSGCVDLVCAASVPAGDFKRWRGWVVAANEASITLRQQPSPHIYLPPTVRWLVVLTAVWAASSLD